MRLQREVPCGVWPRQKGLSFTGLNPRGPHLVREAEIICFYEYLYVLCLTLICCLAES